MDAVAAAEFDTNDDSEIFGEDRKVALPATGVE